MRGSPSRPGGLDVVAVGHALVDIRARVTRLAGPDEEGEILEETRGAGGSAANVAIDVSLLGGRAGVVAKIGFDGFGRIVYEELWRARVDLSGLRISPGHPTGFSFVAIAPGGEIAIYSSKGAAEALEPGEVPGELLARAGAVHIASLRLDTSMAAARAARRGGALVSWDPGRGLAARGLDAAAPLLGLVDVVLVNRLEARALTGSGDPLEAARRIASLGPGLVVVKLGPQGALAYDAREGRALRVPAFRPPRVVDETGAGDAFAAALLLGLARGWGLEASLRLASAVAALKVSRLGSHSVPSLGEAARLAGLELG
ncbi:MAG: PfkB family carbohydrate kinase [Desulfurococcales archaeon]|nr:PfkB family carbohydrate kinase [Desulfurococcales archaeon]